MRVSLTFSPLGAGKLIEDAIQILQDNETMVINDEINEITQLMQQRIQEVNLSLSHDQQQDMERHEFAFLNRSQLEMLFGQKGAFFAELLGVHFLKLRPLKIASIQDLPTSSPLTSMSTRSGVEQICIGA